MQDGALVRKILEGDRLAGEQFVTAHYARVYRLLRCLTDDTDTAQDLTQQTFTRAWDALGSFHGKARLATWLHKIAYHEYTHWLRSRHDHLPLDMARGVADLSEARGLDSILVSRALAQLPTELRETFLLFYMQQFSIDETAEIVQAPTGTIKSRLFTARQRLRELLQAADVPVASLIPPAQAEVHVLVSGLDGGHR